MASSGVVTFSVNENDIITDALQEIGVLASGETATADDYVLARRKLNMIVKQWAGAIDFAPGLKMWARKRAYLFLQKNQVSYSIGPSGDNVAAGSYVTTTTTAASNSGGSSLTVSSISGIATTNYIGVELVTGALQWTTVNGAPSGSTVALTATLTANVAQGARVFVYTTKARRPMEILTANMRTTDAQDTPMDVSLTLDQYEAITNKTATGTPDQIYYEPQLTNGTIYLNRSPNDVTKVVSLVYLSPPEDFTATSDTADYSQEWYRALCVQLAIDLCGPFQKDVPPDMRVKRNEAVQIAQNANPQRSVEYFGPNEDGCA